jgi:hypothetical protein
VVVIGTLLSQWNRKGSSVYTIGETVVSLVDLRYELEIMTMDLSSVETRILFKINKGTKGRVEVRGGKYIVEFPEPQQEEQAPDDRAPYKIAEVIVGPAYYLKRDWAPIANR